MCTLTYLPTQDGFVLTHSRDEDRHRPSSAHVHKGHAQGKTFHYPRDERAGGTWMSLHADGRAACLLNGGQVQYERAAAYPVSRGEIILQLWQYPDFPRFFHQFDRTAYEPFTLVVWEAERLHALYHNPGEDDWQEYDPAGAHIWSSTRLYPGPERWKRAENFFHWRRLEKAPTPAKIRRLHLEGDPTQNVRPFTLHHKALRTVSLTQVTFQQAEKSLFYQPLPAGTPHQVNLR
jgi:uncharacterized protein with NRDE domain